MPAFNPAKDIPSLSGKVILVTGGNIGLGKQSILELVQHNPSQIWLAARNLAKAESAVADIRRVVPGAPIQLLELDLASLESVKKAAATFSRSAARLDILMLNAGIMATPPGVTKDGYEIQFGTNHVGHALLTKLLLPILLKSAGDANADVRVVVLASKLHTMAPDGGIQFDTLGKQAEDMDTWARYGQSKLANILFARELAKRYPQLNVVSVHPGLVDTNLSSSWLDSTVLLRGIRPILMLVSKMFIKSVEDGVKNQLWASFAKPIAAGEYYEPVGVIGKASSCAKDDELAKKLWKWTEMQLEGHNF
ncbi:hypothetical protein FOBRF1_006651 [Fusarium oxysporum]